MPLVKSTGKRILKSGLKTGVGLASDALRGKDMRQALRHRVTGAFREVTGLPVTTGSDRKRKATGYIRGKPNSKKARHTASHGKAHPRKLQRSYHRPSKSSERGDIFGR